MSDDTVKVFATEPLRVGLDELLTAETDGKWWLVGAGWSGDPLVEHQQEIRHKRKRGEEAQDEDKLLDVARQQGMNTDVRRSIFVVLMTSEVRRSGVLQDELT